MSEQNTVSEKLIEQINKLPSNANVEVYGAKYIDDDYLARWPLSDLQTLISSLRQQVRELTAERDAQHRVLELWRERFDYIDNGKCAVCRIGHRLHDLKGNVGICEWQECISHDMRKVLEPATPLTDKTQADQTEDV